MESTDLRMQMTKDYVTVFYPQESEDILMRRQMENGKLPVFEGEEGYGLCKWLCYLFN